MVTWGSRGRWALTLAVFGVPLLFARTASANVNFVMDAVVNPPELLRSGDFPESAKSDFEGCRLHGRAINNTSATLRLLVRLRMNGASAPDTQQVFELAPNAETDYDYKILIPGSSVTTLGAELESPDGSLALLDGIFSAAPAPPPFTVPALGPFGGALLGVGLGFLGIALVRRKLVASS
jgi:hypothetical protein